ncbi:MAG: 4-alpha-glucanotransferase [Candidatus Omnitrophica bacterium]|nr:4-alpha-glucanotransferase [Candidatus Omnitrophota bacterium]MBU4479037.1 4-alpha-glucanotransferase [Candidatus Omnitrophota bacterium]MCG2703522.1 4-alpha-glucanotransferase [Candidatus Omnitrophota bacterium]
MKKIFKTSSIILIQAFLAMNFAWGGVNDFQSDSIVFSQDTLSPALQINTPLLRQVMRQETAFDYAANLVEIYQKNAYKTYIQIFARPEGYRVVIKAEHERPLTLHWGVNHWQKPPEAIIPNGNGYSTYVDETTGATRTEVQSQAKGNNVFVIDIPTLLIDSIENLKFVFFDENTAIQDIGFKDYEVPIKNALDKTIEEMEQGKGKSEENRSKLEQLLKNRLTPPPGPGEQDLNDNVLYSKTGNNVISEVIRGEGGFKINFWVISNDKPQLYWGINGWQMPSKDILPADTRLGKKNEEPAVYTDMDKESEDGLYTTSIFISDEKWPHITEINFNIHYPDNGHRDTNEDKHYDLKLTGPEMIGSLAKRVNNIYLPEPQRKETAMLLKNALTVFAEEISYEELLKIFQEVKGISFEEQESLGFILIAKLLNEGAVWDEAQGRIIVDKNKVSTAVAELIDRLDPLCVNKCLYLFGMLEPSWISRLVHGLDYRQLYEGQQSGRITDLRQFIQDKINAYDAEDKPEVLEAKAVSGSRLFLKMNFNGNVISTFMGYVTKEDKYYYNGKRVVLRDTLGNEFSRLNLRLGRHVDKEKIRVLIEDGHKKGIKFMVNFFDWHSPEVLNKDNYMYYHHKFLGKNKDELTILSILDNYATILSLPDGRKVLVMHRPLSADQLKPNLTLDSRSGNYWKQKFLEHMRYFIDEFDIDAFRVDLPGELEEAGNREVFQSACFEAVEYAARKGKKIFFCLEAYSKNYFGTDECALFNDWNNHAEIRKYRYKPFRPYYDMVNKSLLTGNITELKAAFERIVRRVEELVSLFTNFDEELLKDMIPDKEAREKHVMMLYNFVRAGFDALMYLRDLGIGDIVSMVGGKSIGWGALVRYFTHKPATKREFRARMEKSTGELVDESALYQIMKNAGRHSFSRVFFRGNKIVFYRPGYAPEVFDLDKMVSPMPAIELLDMEHYVNLWLDEHVLSIPNVKENYSKALRVIDQAISSYPQDNSAAANALYEAVCKQENKNFVRWDWTKHKTATLVMRHDQALTVDNGHPFVVAIRKKGQEEFERVESLEIEENKKYMSMLFGLEPGKYEINFLWPRKHENQGWEEGGWFSVEVLTKEQSEKVKSYSLSNLPKQSFLLRELRTFPRQQISRLKYRRKDKNFIIQVPVFSCRQENNKNKGIGKFTDFAATCQMYNDAVGANVFLPLPIHPTLDDEYSSYSAASNHALNERLIDWDAVIGEFFPHLKEQKPPYLKHKGYIDYEAVEKRDCILSSMVMDELEKMGDSFTLSEQLNKFSAEFSWWFDDYARFRTLTELLGTPWWDWGNEQIQQAEQKDGYKETICFYKFAQFIAFKQWQKAKDNIHALGFKLLYDKPYFCAVNSVEVWTSYRDNKNYFLDRNRHPGVGGKKLQIFKSLALYNYTNLANQQRPYELILNDHEYKLDVLGFDGGRLDALHKAYPWGEEWLRSGDEPGDALVEAIKSVYDQRNNTLLIAEQLGADGEVMKKIRGKGITTMEHLEWLWFKDNIMLSLTSHDEGRVGDRYGGWNESLYKDSSKEVFDHDPEYVCWTVGDEFMDTHRINNPYLEREERMNYNWRYLLPHPLDSDYNKRVKEDLTPYIRSLAAEYLGDWDAMFYEGVDKGRDVFINGLSAQMRSDIENQINFRLVYHFGNNEFKNIENIKIKDLFKEIYRQLAINGKNGEYSLAHHAHNQDFFSTAKNILEIFLGLTRNENADVWEYIDSLEKQMLMDSRRYKRDSANIKLMGFMSGIFEKIEETARSKTQDIDSVLRSLSPDAEYDLAELVEQAV